MDVEPTDRRQSHVVADQVDHRGPPLRVARGRDRPGRLVEEHVRERLELDPCAVHLDPVAAPDLVVEAARLAVDGDPAGADQLVGPAARRDARAGQERVQAHAVLSGS